MHFLPQFTQQKLKVIKRWYPLNKSLIFPTCFTSFHKFITIVPSLHTPCPPPLINFQAIKSIFLFLEGHEEPKSRRFVLCILAKGVCESNSNLVIKCIQAKYTFPIEFQNFFICFDGF